MLTGAVVPAITGLDDVGLSVRDLHASATWYVCVLRLSRVFERFDEDRSSGNTRAPPSVFVNE
jgi:hypothetical protein